jgi:hypothetical protein
MVAYRIKQLARPNGPVSRATLFREIAAGRLVARKIGSATVILEDDWRRYLEGAPRIGGTSATQAAQS